MAKVDGPGAGTAAERKVVAAVHGCERSVLDRQMEPGEDTTLEDAAAKLGRDVYAAAMYLEKLECAELITGSGHHAAQNVVKVAATELGRRWKGRRDG